MPTGASLNVGAPTKPTNFTIIWYLATSLISILFAVSHVVFDHIYRWRGHKPLAGKLITAMISSIATTLPPEVIRALFPRPDLDKVRNSIRYSSLKSQVLEHVQKPGFSGYWICRGFNAQPIDPRDADLVILHMHGGGYVLGHPSMYAPNLLLIAGLLAREDIVVAIFALDYTPVPSQLLPFQINEACEAYNWITHDLRVQHSKIAVMGESAGGHLALSLLTSLYLRGSEKPGYTFLLGPWCNLRCSNPKAYDIDPAEAGFRKCLVTWGSLAAKNLSPKERQLYLNFARRCTERGLWSEILPEVTWVSTGSDETFFVHDIEDFIHHAREDGVTVIYELEEDAKHAWQTESARSQHSAFLALPLQSDDTSLLDGFRRFAASIVSVVKKVK